MTSSVGSLETSTTSWSTPFSFSSSSFTDHLQPCSNVDGQAGSAFPKYKSGVPSSLPLSPLPFSPSAFFAASSGLMDSPAFLCSNMFPSPSTGAFVSGAFNWAAMSPKKDDESAFVDFSFQTGLDGHVAPPSSMPVSLDEHWKVQQNVGHGDDMTSDVPMQVNGRNSTQVPRTGKEQRTSDDGYCWRKYGQKQVKGSKHPRSYFRCTHPNCPSRKIVERSTDRQIIEIVYKASHNHPKPQPTGRNSSSSQNFTPTTKSETSYLDSGMHLGVTPENSSDNFGDDDITGFGSQVANGGDEFDDEEVPEPKRRKPEAGDGLVKEQRLVVQTMSEIDILDDGFRWRKYGQKVVRGNPNPRSYYKCTSTGCSVRKHVERACHDARAVITTYDGRHNHDVPSSRRGSGANVLYKPLNNSDTTTSNTPMAIRPSAAAAVSNSHFVSSYQSSAPPNTTRSFVNSQWRHDGHDDGFFPVTKDVRNDEFFFESLLD